MIIINRNSPWLIAIIIVPRFAKKEGKKIVHTIKTNFDGKQKISFFTKTHLEWLTLVHESLCIDENELLSATAIYVGRISWLFYMNLKNKIEGKFLIEKKNSHEI